MSRQPDLAAEVPSGAMHWGLLGPAALGSERRTRILGLGAVVRHFNECAVPGIGGLWFGRQALLATLGVQVAQDARRRGARVSNIECANAIEALACMLALRERGWRPDPRLRGSTKLPREHALDFRSIRRAGFYVTQPMRMATVQALPPLGLVATHASRFNSFEVTAAAEDLLDAAFEGYRPHRLSVTELLVQWVCNGDKAMDTTTTRQALSPCAPLPQRARELLRDRLLRGASDGNQSDRRRRRNALAWMDGLQGHGAARPIAWERRPDPIDEDHWADMHAGAELFATRDAAIEVLNALERALAVTPGETLTLKSPRCEDVPLEGLKRQAQAFLELSHDDQAAASFCRRCSEGTPRDVLAGLLDLDGRVLRRVGEEVRPGMAFRRGETPPAAPADEGAGGADADAEGAALDSGVDWPEHISFRVPNLYRLALDLHGELDDQLSSSPEARADE